MSGKTLCETVWREENGYAPLSNAAVNRILQFDRAKGFGPNGTQGNRNRFYIYLTQRGSDVQVRTVAVKARKRWEEPVLKEVLLASVDDPCIHVKDVALNCMAGYCVDWTAEGFGRRYYWAYDRWEQEPYKLYGSWKIWAPVVNPELLGRTRRFKWSDYGSANAHILDYLKAFNANPEIELLSKQGLGRLCTKVSLVKKLKRDPKFRQFFARHAAEIKSDWQWNVPVIMKAFRKGISFQAAYEEIEVVRSWNGHSLPREVCRLKAWRYIDAQSIYRGVYTRYLSNCQTLGLDLADTKVSFPHDFEVRRQAVQDQIDAIRAADLAAAREEARRKLSAVADAWSWLTGAAGPYCIVIPRTAAELSAEGKAMGNCIGSYAGRVGRGQSLVFFVRRADRPEEAFVDVEYDPQEKRVLQCYGAQNSKPPQEVQDFVELALAGGEAAEELVA